MKALRHLRRNAVSLLVLGTAAACHPGSPSEQHVVDVPHTPARAQVIGNCWTYAALGWVESLVLQAGGGSHDYSEAYITLRHFEEQLMSGSVVRLEAAGSFAAARSLIVAYGLVPEAVFPSVVDGVSIEASAMEALNSSLANGVLSRLPSNAQDRRALVHAELSRAFGVSLPRVESAAVPAATIAVPGTGTKSLSEELYQWSYVDFPLNFEELPGSGGIFPYQARLNDEQQALLVRMKRALGARKPVLVAWLVDSNAMKDGVFSAGTWREKGTAGDQGMHLSVAADYTASGIDPDSGEPFRVGEGEVSERERELAQRFGAIDSLILKNSWGPGGYVRQSVGGFARLDADYLFSWFPRPSQGTDPASSDLVLRSLVLPND